MSREDFWLDLKWREEKQVNTIFKLKIQATLSDNCILKEMEGKLEKPMSKFVEIAQGADLCPFLQKNLLHPSRKIFQLKFSAPDSAFLSIFAFYYLDGICYQTNGSGVTAQLLSTLRQEGYPLESIYRPGCSQLTHHRVSDIVDALNSGICADMLEHFGQMISGKSFESPASIFQHFNVEMALERQNCLKIGPTDIYLYNPQKEDIYVIYWDQSSLQLVSNVHSGVENVANGENMKEERREYEDKKSKDVGNEGQNDFPAYSNKTLLDEFTFVDYTSIQPTSSTNKQRKGKTKPLFSSNFSDLQPKGSSQSYGMTFNGIGPLKDFAHPPKQNNDRQYLDNLRVNEGCIADTSNQRSFQPRIDQNEVTGGFRFFRASDKQGKSEGQKNEDSINSKENERGKKKVGIMRNKRQKQNLIDNGISGADQFLKYKQAKGQSKQCPMNMGENKNILTPRSQNFCTSTPQNLPSPNNQDPVPWISPAPSTPSNKNLGCAGSQRIIGDSSFELTLKKSRVQPCITTLYTPENQSHTLSSYQVSTFSHPSEIDHQNVRPFCQPNQFINLHTDYRSLSFESPLFSDGNKFASSSIHFPPTESKQILECKTDRTHSRVQNMFQIQQRDEEKWIKSGILFQSNINQLLASKMNISQEFTESYILDKIVTEPHKSNIKAMKSKARSERRALRGY